MRLVYVTVYSCFNIKIKSVHALQTLHNIRCDCKHTKSKHIVSFINKFKTVTSEIRLLFRAVSHLPGVDYFPITVCFIPHLMQTVVLKDTLVITWYVPAY